jgi:hypothetical protein
VTIVDGRESLFDEARRSPVELRAYLAAEVEALTNSDDFLDSLAGHLPGDSGSQSRVPIVIQRIRALATL